MVRGRVDGQGTSLLSRLLLRLLVLPGLAAAHAHGAHGGHGGHGGARGVFCRRCGTKVTTTPHWHQVPAPSADTVRALPEVAPGATLSRHRSSPASMWYDVATFRRATNVVPQGKPQDAQSFFPPYYWEPVFCKTCGAHLGWRFVARRKRDMTCPLGLDLPPMRPPSLSGSAQSALADANVLPSEAFAGNRDGGGSGGSGGSATAASSDAATIHFPRFSTFQVGKLWSGNAGRRAELNAAVDGFVRPSRSVFRIADRVLAELELMRRGYDAIHVRRGDFLNTSWARVGDLSDRGKALFDAVSNGPAFASSKASRVIVFVATDDEEYIEREGRERLKAAGYRHVVTWPKRFHNSVSPLSRSLTEQLICARARVFAAQKGSTWSTYVEMLRSRPELLQDARGRDDDL